MLCNLILEIKIKKAKSTRKNFIIKGRYIIKMGCEETPNNITVGFTNENFKDSQSTIAINGIGNGEKAKEMTNVNGNIFYLFNMLRLVKLFISLFMQRVKVSKLISDPKKTKNGEKNKASLRLYC